jgi:hypothetical protein
MPSAHRSIRLRVTLQIVAAVIAAAAVIAWSSGHYRRYDFSRSHRFELSGQTRQVLSMLGSPVSVTVYFSPTSTATGSELYGDVTALLREYQFQNSKGITVERVDPLRNPARARELQAENRFQGTENVLVVKYADRSIVIPVAEMGEYDTAPTQYGEPPRLVAFRGEQVLTSALIGLAQPESLKKTYFLQGHGETLPGLPPMQIIGQNLKRQNIRTAPLDLSANSSVPADAALVVVSGAHFDLAAPEIAVLRDYWKGGGHLMVLLDPTGETPLLDAFLEEAGGIRPRNDRVLRLISLGGSTGILRDVTGQFFHGSEITDRLVGLTMLFAGNTRSLSINDQKDPSLRGKPLGPTRPLIRAIHGFRGCSDYANADGKGVTFDPVKDDFFPVYLAAITDLGGVRDDRVSLGASRMVVVGNCEFVKDKFLNGTGIDFLSSAVNTLIDRTQLSGTTPKTKEFFTLNLDDLQMEILALLVMAAVPAAAALAGVIFLWRRRA